MTIREALEQENPDALFYPERFDGALAGMTLGFGAKADTKPVAVYDRDKLVKILREAFAEDAVQDDDERDLMEEAEEWLTFNMSGACLGPNAPVIVIMGDSL